MDDKLNEYIQELVDRIKYLERINDDLRKEIRTQRKEIADLKEEKRTILNQDLPPEYNSTLDFK
jgi:hypothetical protein